jgi:hypothetical protein
MYLPLLDNDNHMQTNETGRITLTRKLITVVTLILLSLTLSSCSLFNRVEDISIDTTIAYTYDDNGELSLPYSTVREGQRFYAHIDISIHNPNKDVVEFTIEMMFPKANDVNLVRTDAIGPDLNPKKVLSGGDYVWILDPPVKYAAPSGNTILSYTFQAQGAGSGSSELHISYESDHIREPKEYVKLFFVEGSLPLLETPIIMIEGDRLVWQKSEDDFEKYLLTIDDGQEFEVYSNSYHLSYFEPGDHTIRVVSIGSYYEYISSNAGEFNFTKLQAPTVYLENGQMLTWDPVPEAMYYVVVTENQVYQTTDTQYDLINVTQGQSMVHVIAKSYGANIASSVKSNTVSVFKLSTPDVQIINSNYITWSSVNRADNYDIYINGVHTATVENTMYVLDSGANMRVTVVAQSDTAVPSDHSNEIIYNKG